MPIWTRAITWQPTTLSCEVKNPRRYDERKFKRKWRSLAIKSSSDMNYMIHLRVRVASCQGYECTHIKWLRSYMEANGHIKALETSQTFPSPYLNPIGISPLFKPSSISSSCCQASRTTAFSNVTSFLQSFAPSAANHGKLGIEGGVMVGIGGGEKVGIGNENEVGIVMGGTV